MSKWVTFEKVGISASGRTSFWNVVAKGDGLVIGEVKWFGRWRTYAFFPAKETVWEPTCLRDVADFIKEQTNAKRVRGV